MKNKKKNNFFLLRNKIFSSILFILILIFVDQFFKIISRDYYSFFIRPTQNSGISFNQLSNFPLFLLILSIIILIFFIIFFIRNFDKISQNKITYLISILILSGAIGNTIDRLFLGYVRDFLYMYFFVNNLSDIYISIAFILIIFNYKRVNLIFNKF